MGVKLPQVRTQNNLVKTPRQLFPWNQNLAAFSQTPQIPEHLWVDVICSMKPLRPQAFDGLQPVARTMLTVETPAAPRGGIVASGTFPSYLILSDRWEGTEASQRLRERGHSIR